MQTYANALLIAIPAFVVLLLIEAIYGAVKGNQTFRHLDTISSLSSGVTNVVKDSLGLAIVIISYPFILGAIALFEIETTWLLYVLGFIAIDFAGYWSHRLNHSVNVFWNNHVIHHSSEEFNLACALRQSISNIIGYYALFLVPAALLGIPAEVINIIAPIHLFLQFWYHTQHIPKMGLLEYVIITPSQHRVHHAINPEYLDKNLGQIFTWWDRMFGTFQEELDDVPPVYGITRPARTWNPILINFQHIWLLAKDAWRTKHWRDKLRLWFMPTGWRPADVEAAYPVYKVGDIYAMKKYDICATPRLIAWAWFQFVVITALLLFMLFKLTAIGFPDVLYYGAFIFCTIYGFTSVMDRLRSGVIVHVLVSAIGLGVVLWTGDWFGMGAWWSAGPYLVGLLWSFSLVSTPLVDGYERKVAAAVPAA